MCDPINTQKFCFRRHHKGPVNEGGQPGMQHSNVSDDARQRQVQGLKRVPASSASLSHHGRPAVCDAVAVLVQSMEPFKLRGEERKNALEDAEAAAEAGLCVLISDNSLT